MSSVWPDLTQHPKPQAHARFIRQHTGLAPHHSLPWILHSVLIGAQAAGCPNKETENGLRYHQGALGTGPHWCWNRTTLTRTPVRPFWRSFDKYSDVGPLREPLPVGYLTHCYWFTGWSP